MTFTVIQMPLTGVKRDITRDDAVDGALALDAVITAGNAALIIDNTLIDLAKVHSGQVYVPSEELRDVFLANNGPYSGMDADFSAIASCKRANPKLSAIYQEQDGALVTLNTLALASNNMYFIVNRPSFAKRGIDFVVSANENLSDYLRESLP